MKYYKITLPKDKQLNLVYPPNYKEEIENLVKDHLYWDEGDQTYLVVLINDKDSVNILRDNIEEITEADVATISEANEQARFHINDPAKLEYVKAKMQSILLKQALGLPLTAQEAQGLTPEDEATIDPASPAMGIVSKPTLADRVATLKTNESINNNTLDK